MFSTHNTKTFTRSTISTTLGIVIGLELHDFLKQHLILKINFFIFLFVSFVVYQIFGFAQKTLADDKTIL